MTVAVLVLFLIALLLTMVILLVWDVGEAVYERWRTRRR